VAAAGAHLTFDSFDNGWLPRAVAFSGVGEVVVTAGRAVYTAPDGFTGLDRFGLVLCSPGDDCALGVFEVAVRGMVAPILGFGTTVAPELNVDAMAVVDTGLGLVGSAARVVALPLAGLGLGAAMFSLGGAGTASLKRRQSRLRN
jgi:hypothetical protein